jgi:hypothetical protein
MSWNKMFSIFGLARGDPVNALIWLGWDFLEKAEERKIREENRQIDEWNRLNAIANHEVPRFGSWAFGEEFLANCKEEGTNLCLAMLNQWNKRHGLTLNLYWANGWDHNIQQMMLLWIKVGKP